MATLFEYLAQTQRFLREQKQGFVNPDDLVSYINRARREVALRTQCIRVLTPSSAQVLSATVTAQGSDYANPVVTITDPDFPSGVSPYPNGLQATAAAQLLGGAINAIDITNGGSGYFQPIATIRDTSPGVGSGATADLVVGPINLLNEGQEVYKFSDIDLSGNPGCKSVFYVRSVAIIYANYRYVIPIYAFSEYQAKIRQYPFQYQYVPSFGSFFGQGVGGSLYVYPLPSQTYQMEWDCLCLPSDIETNQDAEAIVDPWTDAVPYFSAHLAMLELQQYNAARMYLDLYEKFALSYSNYTRVGRTVNPYGRY
jgi:hypothetical protein